MKDQVCDAKGFGLYPEDYQESMNHFKQRSNLISSSVKSNPSSSSAESELQRNKLGSQKTNEELIL